MPLPGSWETGTGSPNHSFIQLWAGLVPYGHLSLPITVWTRGWENPVPVSQLSGKDTIILRVYDSLGSKVIPKICWKNSRVCEYKIFFSRQLSFMFLFYTSQFSNLNN